MDGFEMSSSMKKLPESQDKLDQSGVYQSLAEAIHLPIIVDRRARNERRDTSARQRATQSMRKIMEGEVASK